jgi:hypothetical protein
MTEPRSMSELFIAVDEIVGQVIRGQSDKSSLQTHWQRAVDHAQGGEVQVADVVYGLLCTESPSHFMREPTVSPSTMTQFLNIYQEMTTDETAFRRILHTAVDQLGPDNDFGDFMEIAFMHAFTDASKRRFSASPEAAS